jgi:hypothetical protein
MARTSRSPLETRTPVRTISSVMRNAPRQYIRPQNINFGQPEMPIKQDVTSVVRQPTSGNAPVTPTTRPAVSPVVQPTTKPKVATTIKPSSLRLRPQEKLLRP